MDALKLEKKTYYTYSDYIGWSDETRYELLEGIPCMMPSPSQAHQEISGEIFSQLHAFLKGKPYKVFHAPFDVRLNANGKDDTVVQPDILVVCDHSKLDGKCCNGAPDLVMEITSPHSEKYDRLLKFNKYLQAGVREYWIIDPDSKTVAVHILKDGDYITKAYGETDTAPVDIFEGCQIDLRDVFPL